MEEIRVRVLQGWMDEGRAGRLLAVIPCNQLWAVVVWDDESEEPSLFKYRGLGLDSGVRH